MDLDRPVARRRQARQNLYFIARRPYEEPPRHDLGPMDVSCKHCKALHWMDEKTANSSKTNSAFGSCCNHGKVKLPAIRDPPERLRALFVANDAQAREFRDNIRQYNMAFAFTSVGVMEDIGVNRRGAWVFRILGQLSHYSGAFS